MALGDYIRQKRIGRGWSQRDLAAAAHVSNAEISRIEAGKRTRNSAGYLKILADALEVPLDEMLREAGVLEQEDTFVCAPVRKAEEPKEPSMLDGLTEEELREVRQYIDFLISKRKA